MNWLYILSGGLALYSVETADASQPLHITIMVAMLLCLIPSPLEALISSSGITDIGRMIRKNLIANTDD